jgi:hypothetical protein
MRKAPIVLSLLVAAIGVLVMVNVATDTTAITANANRDASDPFVTLSEFDTSFDQAACTRCKATIPCGETCENQPPCKCKTCNGSFDCWRPN